MAFTQAENIKGSYMIEADNLYLKVGKQLILENVSIRVPIAKVTSIMGPNGAGKSTLLKCLTGASPYQQGKVNLNGKSLNQYSLESLSRLRAVLSQSTTIDFPFSAFDIVKMGRNPYHDKSTMNQDDEVVYQALKHVDCLALKDRVFPTLSGGEQQRIQLARVIAQLWETNNTYLFLDEPTSALDLKHQHQVLQLVRELAVRRQIGVCIVMHDLHLAMRYSDQVILMKEGRLFASGDTNEVLTSRNIEHVFEVSVGSIFYQQSSLQ